MGPYIEGLRAWLLERGYTPGGIKQILTRPAHRRRPVRPAGGVRPLAVVRDADSVLRPIERFLDQLPDRDRGFPEGRAATIGA
jgi:hypothetical protein